MQQTEKYKFNLIDPSDDFLPDPLNDNMKAVEAQFKAMAREIGSGGKNARIA